MNRIFLVLSLALGACSTTQQAERTLSGQWVGKPADAFFSRHGLPSSSYALQNGGTLFEWRADRSLSMPAQSFTSFSGGPGGSGSATTTTTGGPLAISCRVQIATDARRVIVEIRPTFDTIGLWQTSRCAEIFNSP